MWTGPPQVGMNPTQVTRPGWAAAGNTAGSSVPNPSLPNHTPRIPLSPTNPAYAPYPTWAWPSFSLSLLPVSPLASPPSSSLEFLPVG